MTRFAANTEVSVTKSRAEIEHMIVRYGATSTAFVNGEGRSMIMFEAQGRRIAFNLPLPKKTERQFTHNKRGWLRTPEQCLEAWEQSCRQKWRALTLVIKAKLEAVESGITSFEDEFLAHIVMPDGITVGEHIKSQIAQSYQANKMLPLLPQEKK